MTRRALGGQAIHLIRKSAEDCNAIDKAALRAKIEVASVRPTPGTSDLLRRATHSYDVGVVGYDGKARAATVYDLVGMMPIHLRKETT